MRSFAILMIVPLLGACYHKTQLAATWRDPSAPPLHFQHGVAVFATSDEALRRSVEDKLASEFSNMTPSYRVVATVDSTTSRADAASQLRAAGFDGAIIMRVTDVTLQPNYVPGAYWYDRPYGFAGYWGASWATPYDPGYIVADKIVTIETQIYSLANDKLIFAARSETTNAKDAKALTDSVIRHIRQQLQKDGLLAAVCLAALRALA
jgi:hypothetical protein